MIKETLQGFWFYHFHKQPIAKVEVTRGQGDLKVGDTLRLIWTDQVLPYKLKLPKQAWTNKIQFPKLHKGDFSQFLQGVTNWEVLHLRTGKRRPFPLFSTKPSPHTYSY